MRKLSLYLVLVLGCAFACSGCQSMSEACAGAAVGRSAVGSIPGVGLLVSAPCIANSTVLMGGKVAGSLASGGGASEGPAAKTFRSSKAVSDDISNSGDIMQFVMTVQDRYRAGDFGEATSEQKVQSIGRYSSPAIPKSVIIVDAQDMWQVMYESEYVPKPVTVPAPASVTSQNS